MASQLMYGGTESESLTIRIQSQWSRQESPLHVPGEMLGNPELPLNLRGCLHESTKGPREQFLKCVAGSYYLGLDVPVWVGRDSWDMDVDWL